MVVVFGEGRAWSGVGLMEEGVAMVIQVTVIELCLFVYAIIIILPLLLLKEAFV